MSFCSSKFNYFFNIWRRWAVFYGWILFHLIFCVFQMLLTSHSRKRLEESKWSESQWKNLFPWDSYLPSVLTTLGDKLKGEAGAIQIQWKLPWNEEANLRINRLNFLFPCPRQALQHLNYTSGPTSSKLTITFSFWKTKVRQIDFIQFLLWFLIFGFLLVLFLFVWVRQ